MVGRMDGALQALPPQFRGATVKKSFAHFRALSTVGFYLQLTKIYNLSHMSVDMKTYIKRLTPFWRYLRHPDASSKNSRT